MEHLKRWEAEVNEIVHDLGVAASKAQKEHLASLLDKYFEETFDLGYRLGVAAKRGGD